MSFLLPKAGFGRKGWKTLRCQSEILNCIWGICTRMLSMWFVLCQQYSLIDYPHADHIVDLCEFMWINVNLCDMWYVLSQFSSRPRSKHAWPACWRHCLQSSRSWRRSWATSCSFEEDLEDLEDLDELAEFAEFGRLFIFPDFIWSFDEKYENAFLSVPNRHRQSSTSPDTAWHGHSEGISTQLGEGHGVSQKSNTCGGRKPNPMCSKHRFQ